MSRLGSVILFNLSDRLYFLQVSSSVVCSFRLSHGKNDLRYKRNKTYWLNILVWSFHRVRERWRGIRKKKTKTFYTGWIAWKIQAKKEEIEEEKNLQKNVSPFSEPLKSKIHPLARQTDQSEKGTCPTHPTGKVRAFSGLSCERRSTC